MRLLVTAPLTLKPQVLVEQIAKISPAVGGLIMTQELWQVYGQAIRQLVPEGEAKYYPLDSCDFGPSATPLRQFEMMEHAQALLILRSQSEPISEPNVHVTGLVNMANKCDMLVSVVDV